MKLYSPLVVLALATSSFANSIPVKRQLQNVFNLNQACQTEVMKYEECYNLYTNLNRNSTAVETVCDTFYTDKCQQFYKNGIKSLEGCKSDNEHRVTYWQGKVDLEVGTITSICGKDEAGNYCPVQSLIIDLNKKIISQDEYLKKLEDSIKETCKSSQCIDIYLKYNLAEAKQEIENSINEAQKNILNEMKANNQVVQNPVNTIPGQNQNMPGQNQNMPGQNQNMPGQNQNMPGQNQNIPDQNQNIPGQNQNTPGQNPAITQTLPPKKVQTTVTQTLINPTLTTLPPKKTPIENPIENPVERPKPMVKRQAQITDEIYQKASEFVKNSGNYLRSEECQAQSGANTLKATSALLASIGLFLYTLL